MIPLTTIFVGGNYPGQFSSTTYNGPGANTSLTGTNGYTNGQTGGIFTGFFQNWYQVPLNANYTYVITMWQDPASLQGNFGQEVISVQDPTNTQVYIGQSMSGENLGAMVQIYFKPAIHRHLHTDRGISRPGDLLPCGPISDRLPDR